MKYGAAMREITFDTETTGLEPNQGHRIVELGCVELIDRVRTGRFFHKYINPERDVPLRAVSVHGLTEEFLSDKPLFRKIGAEFLEFIGDSPLVIHNAAFDMRFINFELERASLPEIKPSRAIDTLAMAREKYPGAKASLDALCDRYCINLSKRDKHGALLDAELLAEVYIYLTGGKQNNMFGEIISTKVATPKAANTIATAKTQNLTTRSFPVAAEELNEHENFISQRIKSSLWNQ